MQSTVVLEPPERLRSHMPERAPRTRESRGLRIWIESSRDGFRESGWEISVTSAAAGLPPPRIVALARKRTREIEITKSVNNYVTPLMYSYIHDEICQYLIGRNKKVASLLEISNVKVPCCRCDKENDAARELGKWRNVLPNSELLLVARLETFLSSFASPDCGIIPLGSPCRLRETSDL
ncbi:hypothetical protein PUN28_010072 [Cardiocondyla obscurior]|uniref:Uncharacterized protein n=1 Tax=Cardiocondyla obscurior TaxID=286306 RepID=A0AAW2FLU3_9HYME